MDDLPPLPVLVRRSLIGAAALLGSLGLILALLMPTLRERRLLGEAQQICDERRGEAEQWLAREGDLDEALGTGDRGFAQEQRQLRSGDEAMVRLELEEMAHIAGLELVDLQLQTREGGLLFDRAPALMVLRGDRADLPPFLQRFYQQKRVVRLVELAAELPSFDSPEVVLELRWEYAAPNRRGPKVRDPSARLAPPRLVLGASLPGIASLNGERWQALERSSEELRALWPRLRALAGKEAEIAMIERRQEALSEWAEASAAEARVLQRKLPPLLLEMEHSPIGRAVLQAGPSGALRVRSEG